MSLLGAPPQNEFLDRRSVGDQELLARARPTTGWAVFFSSAYQILSALTLSGTTANRPTKFLYVGRPYFDTSLGARGKPIWVASVSAGVAVWIDSASNIV